MGGARQHPGLVSAALVASIERGVWMEAHRLELRPMASFVFHPLDDEGRLDRMISGHLARPQRTGLECGSCEQIVDAKRSGCAVRTNGVVPR